jgi:hypothetical protein
VAGPAVHINYITDTATTVRVLVPSWQQAFTTDALATASGQLPKGTQRRRRYLRGDTSGREYRITVGDTTKTAWTAANGAAVASPPTIPGSPDTAFHYGGRVGERDLIRG